uniref:Uncharacterized protein n=1 Tax=Cyprinus carpio TaxID=7962 RepID=A0A8C1N9V8_CYPCA
MAALKACSALVSGANRGLGLEMVKQLLEACCSNIFAACHDPDGPNSEVSIQEFRISAKKVGSLLGKNGLNLLVNNATVLPQKTMLTATVEDMQNTFNTNVIGALFVIREYLPYLRTAAKASGKPGMSCDKAAVINISTDSASMSFMPVLKEPFPFFPYSISKAPKNTKIVLMCFKKHNLYVGSYDAAKKNIIWCIWCNAMCLCSLRFKKHIFFT